MLHQTNSHWPDSDIARFVGRVSESGETAATIPRTLARREKMEEHMDAATIITPIGPFTMVVDADGAVVTSGWSAGAESLLERAGLQASIRMLADVGPATSAAAAYHDGDVGAIRLVEVAQSASPFTERCWEVLRSVPPGHTWTYSDLAAAAGRPAAVRAAAGSCARNRCGLFVPCHRIRRKDGGLGGFAWGVDTKQRLLDLEHSADNVPA